MLIAPPALAGPDTPSPWMRRLYDAGPDAAIANIAKTTIGLARRAR
jgi:hypothetical protein